MDCSPEFHKHLFTCHERMCFPYVLKQLKINDCKKPADHNTTQSSLGTLQAQEVDGNLPEVFR